jgi:hypothetical protein
MNIANIALYRLLDGWYRRTFARKDRKPWRKDRSSREKPDGSMKASRFLTEEPEISPVVSGICLLRPPAKFSRDARKKLNTKPEFRVPKQLRIHETHMPWIGECKTWTGVYIERTLQHEAVEVAGEW